MNLFRDRTFRRGMKVMIVILAIIGILLPLNNHQPWRFLYNSSYSLWDGKGLYRYDRRGQTDFERDQLVAARYVAPAWVQDRNWKRPNIETFLKRIAAVPGDTVVQTGNTIRVCPQGAEPCPIVAERQEADMSGRAFPAIDLNGTVPPDHYMLVADHPLSLDSRYLGLFQSHAILGRAEAVWTRPVPEELKTAEGVIRAYFEENPAITPQSLREEDRANASPQGKRDSWVEDKRSASDDSHASPKGNDSPLTHKADSHATERSEGVWGVMTHLLTQTRPQGGVQGLTQRAENTQEAPCYV